MGAVALRVWEWTLQTGLEATITKPMKMKSLLIFFLFVGISFGAPLQGPGRIGDDLPELKPYQPEKQPNVPIKLGHRRCDNIYHQAILPCLLRPELPPFSYSTERYYNTEYKKK